MNRIISAVSTFLVFTGLAFAQASMRTTTLSLAVGVSDRSINLSSISGISAVSNGQVATILFVDKEVMYVQSVTGSSVTVTRGQSGSDATAHNAAATVYVGPPGAYGSKNLSGACSAGSWPVTPYININNGNIYTCSSNNWVLAGGGSGGTNPTGNGLQSWDGVAWASRSLTAGSNVTITNADGTGGNPVISASGGGSLAIQVGGSAIGNEATLNVIAGTGATVGGVDAGSVINLTVGADTATMLSRATDQAGTDRYCRSTTGNDTYTCNLIPALTVYTRGGCIVLDPDTANTLTATVAVNGLAARSILNRAGAALATGDITANKPITACDDGTQYIIQGDGGGSSGSSLFLSLTAITDGTGWTDYNMAGATKDTSVSGQVSIIANASDTGVNGRYQTVSGAYDKIIGVFPFVSEGVGGILGMFSTDGTRTSTCAIFNTTGSVTETYSVNTPTAGGATANITQSTGYTIGAGSFGPSAGRLVFFRMTNDGTNETCRWSPNGTYWKTVWTRASNAYLTATGVGYFARWQAEVLAVGTN